MLFQLSINMLRARARQLSGLVAMMILALFITGQGLNTLRVALSEAICLTKEVSGADIWVMDPEVRSFEDQKQVTREALLTIQSIKGVKVASPLFVTSTQLKWDEESEVPCKLIGLDETSFLGAPSHFKLGNLNNLGMQESFILSGVNENLRVGHKLLINDQTAFLAGIVKSSEKKPVVYTTISRAKEWSKDVECDIPFILVKVFNKNEINRISEVIEKRTHLKAYTNDSLSKLILSSYLKSAKTPHDLSKVSLIASALSLGILFLSLVSVGHKFRSNFVLFRTIGASKATISLFKLVHLLGISLIAFVVTVLIEKGVGFFIKLAPASLSVSLIDLFVLFFFSCLISGASTLRIKEATLQSEGI